MTGPKIVYHVVAPLELTIGPQELERRRAFLMRFADAGTEIEVRSPGEGRDSIESDWDIALMAPRIIDGLRKAQSEGFDAGIIGCFSDPGIDAAREAVDMPLVGPGAAAVHLALQLGDRFSVISPSDDGSGRTRANMRALGVEGRLASARGMGLSVPELARADAAALDKIAETAERCVSQDGADVLILGCMSMAFLDPTPGLVERLGVPVVNPIIAALKTAEAIHRLGLTHSRARWPVAKDKPHHSKK